jgi:hypothetical protein
MSPTAVIRETWALYKRHWSHLIPIALVVYAILGVVSILLTWALGWLGALLGAFVSILGVFWLQAALVEAVADVRDGRADLSISETFAHGREHLSSVLVAGLLAAIAITLGLILFIVPGLFLMTIWCVIVPVIVLESRSAGESFGRSRELVRGEGWNVFGLIVLVFLILIGAGIILSILLSWLPGWLGSYIQSVVSNSITAPFVAVALTLAYFTLRGRESDPEPALEQSSAFDEPRFSEPDDPAPTEQPPPAP